MRAYELILILRPTLKDEERKKLVSTVKDFLGKPEVVKEDDWGQKTLAYMIKKETSGHYTRLMLEMETDIPQDFEKRLITHDGILRHLFLRREENEKKPSVKAEAPKAMASKPSASAKVPTDKAKKAASKPTKQKQKPIKQKSN
ncbi:MAG: 30S ribosomal protein S6 [Patescibacteria group bacterium]